MDTTVTDPLVRRLEQIGPLDAEDRRLLATLPFSAVQNYNSGQTLACEGSRPDVCNLILSGYACRYRLIGDGRRQIVSLNMSGDLVDLTSLLLDRLDHGIAALTPVAAATIPHAALMNWVERHPSGALALWRNALVDAAMYREWVVNLGARSAYQRIAHLLCELVTRMRAAGLLIAHGSNGAYELPPIRQADLADAVGLTLIHLNRTLQSMRRDGLVGSAKRTMLVLDWEGLKEAARFDPAYFLTAP